MNMPKVPETNDMYGIRSSRDMTKSTRISNTSSRNIKRDKQQVLRYFIEKVTQKQDYCSLTISIIF